MKAEKTTGALFIAGAIGVLVPYIVLSITFEYPMVLRQETGEILTKFHAGGASLIWTWGHLLSSVCLCWWRMNASGKN